jgi:hypothetical protein
MRTHWFVLAPLWPLFALIVIAGAVWAASL